jgi:hypothetical protein
MAQGEAASLLVRLFRETADERYAGAAKRALKPLAIPTAEGGARALIEGRPFFEEYPTDPPSFVLNGAIFALWGYYDVWKAVDDEAARAAFEEGVAVLASELDRWDTGYWSRYDLFPHPIVNVASPAYHALHITQLRALHGIAPSEHLADVAARFERYRGSPARRARALAQKVFFRLLVPRNRVLRRHSRSKPSRSSSATAADGAGDARANG